MPARRRKIIRKTDAPAPPVTAIPTPDVMTIEELARYLKLAVGTLYKKVQAHEIPFTKVGNLLRFTRASIDTWLARNTVAPDESLYAQFARLQNRYHFQHWLEGRGVDWRTLADAQLAELATQAIADLRSAAPKE